MNLMILLIIKWPYFVYLVVDPGFLPPLNFHEAARFVPHRMEAPETNIQADEETSDKRTCLFFRLSVCVLDGVWHLQHGGKVLLSVMVAVYGKQDLQI